MEIERVSWNEIGPEFLKRWGMPKGKFEAEHLAILGPTGSGKSFFMTHVLKERARLRGSHIVIIATKPADKTMTNLGWPISQKWPPNYDQPQVIFWPKAGSIKQSLERQRLAILDMLDELWKPNANIIVSFDEISYIEDELKLSTQIRRYWRESRALGISLVATTQRPFRVGRTMWSEASWKVAFRPTDEEDGKRVAQVLGSQKLYFETLMNDLQRNEFIIIHRDSRQAYISKIPNLKSTSSGSTPGTKPSNTPKTSQN